MVEHLENVEFHVANLDCDAEAAAIRRGLEKVPGIEAMKVYPTSARVSCTFDSSVTSQEQIGDRLAGLGFPQQEAGRAQGPPAPWRNSKVITSVASGVLLLAGWLVGLAGVTSVVPVALYIAAVRPSQNSSSAERSASSCS